jgi:hypothetical protein
MNEKKEEKEQNRTEKRTSEYYHCGAIRMRRVRKQVRIGRRFLLEKLPEQENRTRGDSIVHRHGCNRRGFQSHSRQNTMQLDRIHKPRRAENLHIEKKSKGQNRRPPSFSLLLLRDISVLGSQELSSIYISLFLAASVRPSLLLQAFTWQHNQEMSPYISNYQSLSLTVCACVFTLAASHLTT